MKRTYFIGPFFIREWGNPNGKPLLLIHGNAVHSGIWELVAERFPSKYRIIAPDLRGYGKTSRELKIDAKNGVQNWVDDLTSIVRELRLEQVEVWGHSLGGVVLWGLLAHDVNWISRAVFISTGSPFGFGKLNWEDGAGTGAGFVHHEFVKCLEQKYVGDGTQVFHPFSVYKRLFNQQPTLFNLQKIIEMGFDMDLTEQGYPGDWEKSENWPCRKPGKWGAVNALSPLYQKELIKNLTDSYHCKPELIWIHGKQDGIVSNQSYADIGYLGKIGVIPDWPGEEIYPQQKMIDELRELFDIKKEQGFEVSEIELENCGHFPFLETEEFWELV